MIFLNFYLVLILNKISVLRRDFKNTPANSDGLINCLRQPGQLRNQPQKSMRVNSSQLIIFCGTWTVPAAETKSIGLPADAQLAAFFALRL
jgi:hypothetical protein